MNDVTPEQWVQALESGKYPKARHMLRNDNTGGMCCIGVLHDLVGTDHAKLDGCKTFREELLPEWARDTVLLNELATINDRTAGYPIERIKELYCGERGTACDS